MTVGTNPEAEAAFGDFFREVAPRIEKALIAAYGSEIGTEAFADAMAVAWERWAELSSMSNPAGYVFRVGQSRARPHVRWWARRASFVDGGGSVGALADEPLVIDALTALSQLSRVQRVAVLLTRSWGFSYAETAAVLDVSEAAVSNHIRRGMTLLRRKMEVDRDDHGT